MAKCRDGLNTSHLRLLLKELKEVTTPRQLGIQLGIDVDTVTRLLEDLKYEGTNEKIAAVLTYWLKNTTASRQVLVDALRNMEHERLAETLLQKVKGTTLDVSEEDDDDTQGKRAQLKKSEEDVHLIYGDFLLHAGKLLEEKAVRLTDIKLTWSGYDKHISREACMTKDIPSFLIAICETQGPYKYDRIGGLLILFCEKEGEKLVTDYEARLKVTLHPRVSPVHQQGKRFKVKIDKDLSKDDILDFRNTLAKLLECEADELLLEGIHKNCVELTYVIPIELAKKIENTNFETCHNDFESVKIAAFWIEIDITGEWKEIYSTTTHHIGIKEQELIEAALHSELTMAVIGLPGQGKSTLVNSLLLMDPDSEEAAETGDEGLSISRDVVCFTKCRDNVNVKIWDTPGLQDDTTISPETVIKLLRERAGDEVDLFLYCVAYHPGIRQHDEGRENVIKFLTKHFGVEFWTKALLVLTMVNTVTRKDRIPRIRKNIEIGLKKALQSAGVPESIVVKQRLMLAGLGVERLAVDENNDIEWNTDFFICCLDTVQEGKRATFTQARHGKSFWRSFLEFVLMATEAGTLQKPKAAELLTAALMTEYLIGGIRRKSRERD